jgi:aspartyl-tRNA(Asn)/glutamyl-tRNA(Gln) amidotransferase subunit A
MTPTDRTATDLLAAQATGESAEAITRAFLDAIRQRDGVVKAFLHLDSAAALEQARAVDAKRKAGKSLGPLAGVPVAVKDVLCTKGARTTCGSKILQAFMPPYDAHVITALRNADAVIVGKTNMDEFAMGSSTENSAFHVTRNPWDLSRSPGGSSGGSAAAVAAGEVPVALGTDTGGSVRQPASFCGVVGMKPTYGRVSRFGLVAFASSLDQIGPFGRSVADVAKLMEVIVGHDPRDSTSVDRPAPPYHDSLDEPIRPLTIGVPREYFGEGLDAEVERAVRAAVAVYAGLGAAIKEFSLPHSRFAVATYYLVATAEASSNLARYDGAHYGHRAAKWNPETEKEFGRLAALYSATRAEGFGAEVKRRIMLGTYALSSGYYDAYYLKALKVRRLIKDDFDKAFAECDVVLGPTAPTPAFKIGEKVEDPLAMYLSDVYTISANLAGIPGLSLPCGFTAAGLPIGLQIQAAPFEEEKLLRVARMYERETDWHTRRPSLK